MSEREKDNWRPKKKMKQWTLGRIKDRCEKNSVGCWVWQGAKRPFGYGSIRTKGRGVGAHRLAYELFYGEFEQQKCVLHVCDNPPCCNPEHLFLGTKRDNRLDQIAKGRDPAKSKTHCKWGHEYTAQNTRIETTGKRRCRECYRTMKRRLYRESREVREPKERAK